MSKFKELFETVLKETDWDDSTERYWDRSPVNIEPETLYSKPINPVKKEDLCYLKAIFVNTTTSNVNVYYISNTNGKSPYVKEIEKATKFKVKDGEKFIEQHPKKLVKNKTSEFELHFELEKI